MHQPLKVLTSFLCHEQTKILEFHSQRSTLGKSPEITNLITRKFSMQFSYVEEPKIPFYRRAFSSRHKRRARKMSSLRAAH